jgi:hypothetical protein
MRIEKMRECMNAIMRECVNEDGSRKSEVERQKTEDGSRKTGFGILKQGRTVGKTRLWLTLKTTFFNTKKGVFSQWYALLGSFVVDADRSGDAVRSEERTTDDFDFDLSACVAPDNVKMGKEIIVADADGFVVDADRSGDAVRSADNFDLSACAAPDNVKMEMENNVKMMKNNVKTEMNERLIDDFGWVDADGFVADADRSGYAVRSEERTTDDFDVDLSACAAPDNVKMMKDNVKTEMEVDDNVKKRNGRMNSITTNYK